MSGKFVSKLRNEPTLKNHLFMTKLWPKWVKQGIFVDVISIDAGVLEGQILLYPWSSLASGRSAEETPSPTMKEKEK